MSSQRGAELSNEYAFMAWYLVKHRDNFTFILLLMTAACVNALRKHIVTR
jgi:hypothetical protein